MQSKLDEFNLLQEFIVAKTAIEEQRNYINFIRESNRIENIHRDPTKEELKEFKRFMSLKKITVGQLCKFVAVFQPDAKLRIYEGQNVRIGTYFPPPGGMKIKSDLANLLKRINEIGPFEFHRAYEALHPFSDCNGRSGRMLWAWKTKSFPLGFLHHFYFQALDAKR